MRVRPRALAATGLAFAFFGLFAFGTAGSANAQTAGEDADSLFNAGRELLQQGRFAEACPKFAQSERLLPAVGTALNLGLCLEKLGQTASAVTAYRDAITLASALGPTEAKRITVARDRLASLEPRVAKMQIVVSEDVAGLEVKRDGLAFSKSQYGAWVPVDPIPHVVEATAPGRQPWRTTVAITGDAATISVTVPALGEAPRAVPAPVASPPSQDGAERETHHPVVLTAVLAGVGLVAITAGTVLALDAKSKYDDADSLCDARGCDPRASTIQDGARWRGNVATVAFIVGGAALGGAAFVWFVVPGPRRSTGRTGVDALRVGLASTGVVARGTF